MLEGTGQRHQRLEAGQGGEHHQRRDGIRCGARYPVTGQPQHQGEGPAAQQLHRAVGKPAHPGHAGLGLDQRLFGLQQLVARPGGGGKHLQLGLAVQIVHQTGTQARFFRYQRLSGLATEEIEHQWQGNHAKQQDGAQGEGQLTVKEGEKEHQTGSAEQGRPDGGDQPQVDVVHGVDVGHQPVEQVRLAKACQGASGERRELLPEPDPQPGQHPEGGVVAHHSLTPAAGSADDGEEAHPAGRRHVVEVIAGGRRQPRHGGGGEKPAGERQQSHPGRQGDQCQQQTDGEAEPVLAIEAQKRQEISHRENPRYVGRAGGQTAPARC